MRKWTVLWAENSMQCLGNRHQVIHREKLRSGTPTVRLSASVLLKAQIKQIAFKGEVKVLNDKTLNCSQWYKHQSWTPCCCYLALTAQ